MDFQTQKNKQLSRKDKSNKQTWDKAIVPLCNKINSKRDYYTTSSCAGRIILLIDSEKKQKGLFVFRTHSKISYKELKKVLDNVKSKYKQLICFKQEPCILHVACKTFEAAQQLVNKAKFAGWKRSGIMASSNRIVCELMSTEHLALPIINKGKLLVSDDYLKLLVKQANKKLLRTRSKIKKLEKLL